MLVNKLKILIFIGIFSLVSANEYDKGLYYSSQKNNIKEEIKLYKLTLNKMKSIVDIKIKNRIDLIEKYSNKFSELSDKEVIKIMSNNSEIYQSSDELERIFSYFDKYDKEYKKVIYLALLGFLPNKFSNDVYRGNIIKNYNVKGFEKYYLNKYYYEAFNIITNISDKEFLRIMFSHKILFNI